MSVLFNVNIKNSTDQISNVSLQGPKSREILNKIIFTPPTQPTIDELGTAGLIDAASIDSKIFGTGKFYKEKQDEKKENIYSDIDEMLNSTLKNDDK